MSGRSVIVFVCWLNEVWYTTWKELSGPALPGPTRTSASVPGRVVRIRTWPTLVDWPRSKTRPTPRLRFPKYGLRRYSSVDHTVSESPSAALPTSAGCSWPSPGGGSYSVTAVTGTGVDGLGVAVVGPKDSVAGVVGCAVPPCC